MKFLIFDSRLVEKKERDGQTKPFCEPAWLSESVRKYYMLGLVVLQYFLPLIILTGAYVRMATRLWGATAPGNAEDTRDAAILRNKKRVSMFIKFNQAVSQREVKIDFYEE